jgi:hypothetical protein
MPRAVPVVSPASISNIIQQLANGSTTGVIVNPAADAAGNPAQLGFFGTTPAVQPSGFAESTIAIGEASGQVMTFASKQSPSGVTNLSTAEYSITVQAGTGSTLTPATGDVFIVNKPTSQAGLGVGNMRYSAAGVVAMTFQNYTATMITPTANQIFGIVGVRGMSSVTTVLTPAAVAASTTAEQLFTVPGVAVGNVLVVNKPTTQVGLDIVGARVAGNNQVGVSFVNVTAGVLTPTAGEVYTFFGTNGIDSDSNQILLALTATTPGTLTASSVAAIAVSSSNILFDDTVVGWQKPSLQASVAPSGGFTNTTGVIDLFMTNPGPVTGTPTASEIYQVGVWRGKPAAPAVTYAVTLTPAAVAANTTAEQTFLVTGVVAGSAVVVNKPSNTPGLGIVGARVSSANNIAVNFCNATATTITPASETYLVANFQALIDVTSGQAIVQTAVQANTAQDRLADSMRAALVSLGLIAGA